MNNFVFLASIEGDLLILAGISSLIKDLFPQNTNTLLLPKSHRVHQRVDDYREFFDEVIEVDALDFSSSPPRLFNNYYKIKQLFETLAPYRESIFFLFDIYTLVELSVYSFVKKNRNAQMVTVTAFEGDEIDFDNLECVLKGSIVKSLYSVVLARKIFFEYRIKNSQNAGINYLKAHCHIQLCINNSKHRNNYDKIFENLSYPALFVINKRRENFSKYQIIEPHSVIVFVESQISHWSEDYWGKANKLLERLEEMGVNIYVKDHPNCKKSDVELLDSRNIKVIPQEISAELICTANAHNIIGVLGHGSTSLITASWLMIPAFDTSEYFEFNANILKKLSQFLTLGPDIIKIRYLEDIERIDSNVKVNEKASIEIKKQIWKNIFVKEFGSRLG